MKHFLSQKKTAEVPSDTEQPTEEDKSEPLNKDLLDREPPVATTMAYLLGYESDVSDDKPPKDLADNDLDPVDSNSEAKNELIAVTPKG
jgi:hypothetical protein